MLRRCPLLRTFRACTGRPGPLDGLLLRFCSGLVAIAYYMYWHSPRKDVRNAWWPEISQAWGAHAFYFTRAGRKWSLVRSKRVCSLRQRSTFESLLFFLTYFERVRTYHGVLLTTTFGCRPQHKAQLQTDFRMEAQTES